MLTFYSGRQRMTKYMKNINILLILGEKGKTKQKRESESILGGMGLQFLKMWALS